MLNKEKIKKEMTEAKFVKEYLAGIEKYAEKLSEDGSFKAFLITFKNTEGAFKSLITEAKWDEEHKCLIKDFGVAFMSRKTFDKYEAYEDGEFFLEIWQAEMKKL